MSVPGKRQKGFSLIEVLIALVIGLIVIAGVYRAFTAQQKNFVIQEQVSEVQQSVRTVMDLIARDIRMAGFGQPPWAVGGSSDTVTITIGPNPAPNRDITLELVGAFATPIALLGSPATIGQNQIVLDHNEDLVKDENLLVFEQYYGSDPSGNPLAPPIPSIRYTNAVVWSSTGPGGSITIDIDANGSTTGTRDGLDIDLRADAAVAANRKIFSHVYKVEKITYHWVENTRTLERNNSLLATDVSSFQVTDLGSGSFQVVLTVETRTDDPDFAAGRRARTLTSTIRARNVITS
jgi:prepilin-type N-terminal cleavage/methylation domain-containing protein